MIDAPGWAFDAGFDAPSEIDGRFGPSDSDHRRKIALRALCQTSKRTSNAATPFLYADVRITATGAAAIDQMTYLFTTLAKYPRLVHHIAYVQTQLNLGERTEGSDEEELAIKRAVESPQDILARVYWSPRAAELWLNKLRQSPNQGQVTLLLGITQNLSHARIGSSNGSLSRLLGLELAACVANHRPYAKLESLEIWNNPDQFPDGNQGHHCKGFPDPEPYIRLISSLRHLLSLRHFHHAWPCDVLDALEYPTTLPVRFDDRGLRNVSTLHLIDCFIPVNQVILTLEMCKCLREFRHSSSMRDTSLDYNGLCNALEKNKATLEYLYLAMGVDTEVNYDVTNFTRPLTGFFADFPR